MSLKLILLLITIHEVVGQQGIPPHCLEGDPTPIGIYFVHPKRSYHAFYNNIDYLITYPINDRHPKIQSLTSYDGEPDYITQDGNTRTVWMFKNRTMCSPVTCKDITSQFVELQDKDGPQSDKFLKVKSATMNTDHDYDERWIIDAIRRVCKSATDCEDRVVHYTFDEQNKMISQETYKQSSLAPTAMASLTELFITFYGEIYGFAFFVQQNRPFVANYTDEYDSSKTWLGCPKELCFNGRLSAAIKTSSNEALVIAGLYGWTINFTAKLAKISQPSKILDSSIDAIVAMSTDSRLHIRSKTVEFVTSGKKVKEKSFKEVFPNSSKSVEAAVRISSSQVVLISYQNFSIYELNETAEVGTFVSSHNLASRWLNIPDDIEAALISPRNSSNIMFFSSNFMFEAPNGGGHASNNIFQEVLDCPKSIYQKYGTQLNFNNKAGFLKYRKQFRPEFIEPPVTIFPSTTTEPPSSSISHTPEGNTNSSKTLLIVLIVVVFTIIIIAIAAFVVVKRMKITSTNQYTKFETMTNDFTTIRTVDSLAKTIKN